MHYFTWETEFVPYILSMIAVLELQQFSLKTNLIKNLETEKTPVWIFSNIQGLAQVMDATFDLDLPNE